MGNSHETTWYGFGIAVAAVDRHKTPKETSRARSHSPIRERRRAFQSPSFESLDSLASPTVQLRVPSADLTGIVHWPRGSLLTWLCKALYPSLRTSFTGTLNDDRIKTLLSSHSTRLHTRSPAPLP